MNHRAVGDSVTSEQIIVDQSACRSGCMSTQLQRAGSLDLRALAALEHMRFTTRHRIEGAYSGRHQSRQQGGAGEFVDFREYSGSEDLRRLDWKVLARTRQGLHVRLHQDETNLLCTLVPSTPAARCSSAAAADGDGRPDRSSNMHNSWPPHLSHVIARGQDQVGLADPRRGAYESAIPPAGTQSHAATRLQEAIERRPPRGRRPVMGPPGCGTCLNRAAGGACCFCTVIFS